MPDQNRGADLVIRSLEIARVQYVFTLSGNQIMPLFDACVDAALELIHVRHEAAAVHMADAWGRCTGEPGVALVTAGPGFANVLSAMYVALMAESPLVVLSGHAPTHQLNRGAFQEMPQAQMAGHVTKASWTSTDTSQLGHDLARAFRLATSGRPGPVHVSLPADLLSSNFTSPREALPQADDFHPTISLLDVQSADSFLSALATAEKPLVLAGPATMRPADGELLASFAEKSRVPVIGMESPRGINDPSLGALAEVLIEADLIVLIGKRLNFTLRSGDASVINPSCRFMQIDPETTVLEQTSQILDNSSRLVRIELADAVPALERLTRQVSDRSIGDDGWYHQVETALQYRPKEWDALESPVGNPFKRRADLSGGARNIESG